MLYFIIIWTILLATTAVIGIGILNAMQAEVFKQTGDRLAAALWLGTIALAVSLLAVSLLLPLSPLVGVAVAVCLGLLAVRSPQTLQELHQLRYKVRLSHWLLLLGTAIALAALMSRQVIWLDTGLYHYGAIRWLADFGAVPGVALLYSQLGFTSSWLALAAPLNPHILGSHVTAVTNGFILLVAILHFMMSLKQATGAKPALSDWFSLVFLALVLPILLCFRFMFDILVSPSPDIPSLFLIGIVAWVILLICNSDKHSLSHQDNSQSVVLFLAAGALTIKLIALPLLMISGLFYLVQIYQSKGRNQLHFLLVGIGIVGLILAPLISSSIITSGCPLFPATTLCLNLPWSPLLSKAQANTVNTLNWTSWFPPPPPGQSAVLWFLNQWFSSNRSNQMIVWGFGGSLLLMGYLIWTRLTRQSQGQLWLLATGGLGMVFLLLTSPLFRFVLGYLVIVPALAIAFWFWKWQKRRSLVNKAWPNHFSIPKTVPLMVTGSGVGLALAIALTTVHQNLAINSNSPIRLLLPPAMPSEEMVQKQTNAITYFSPKQPNALCWSSPLPCAFEVTADIDLRHPSEGLRAGFIRRQDF